MQTLVSQRKLAEISGLTHYDVSRGLLSTVLMQRDQCFFGFVALTSQPVVEAGVLTLLNRLIDALGQRQPASGLWRCSDTLPLIVSSPSTHDILQQISQDYQHALPMLVIPEVTFLHAHAQEKKAVWLQCVGWLNRLP